MAVENSLLPPDLFLDTSFIAALTVRDDANHAVAQSLSRALRAAGTQIVTTEAILLEIGNMFSKQHWRGAAVTADVHFRQAGFETLLLPAHA